MRFLFFCHLLVSVLILSGCSQEKGAGRYGMMNEGTPQFTAIQFTNAIYNDKDLNAAIALSNERFGKILKNHHTTTNIQRRVFQVRFDKVTAEAVSGSTLLGVDSRRDAEIEVKLDGTYDGERAWDLKTITLKKIRGDWKVVSVKDTMP